MTHECMPPTPTLLRLAGAAAEYIGPDCSEIRSAVKTVYFILKRQWKFILLLGLTSCPAQFASLCSVVLWHPAKIEARRSSSRVMEVIRLIRCWIRAEPRSVEVPTLTLIET